MDALASVAPFVIQASLLDNSIAAVPSVTPAGSRGVADAGSAATAAQPQQRGRTLAGAAPPSGEASPLPWGGVRPRSRTPQDVSRGFTAAGAASSLPSPAFSTASGFSSKPPIAPGRGGTSSSSSSTLPPRATVGTTGRSAAQSGVSAVTNDAVVPGQRNPSKLVAAAAALPTAGGAWPAGGSGSSSMFSRVKVAVRCRPPFPEEGPVSAVKIGPSLPDPDAGGAPDADVLRPRTLQLEVSAGKLREFTYDVVFGPECDNNDVYNGIAGPVVEGVLNGVNGTVLAYGQTGSGKTHSLGILARISGESGIIPRSLSHIFGAIQLEQAAAAQAEASGGSPAPGTRSYTVTLSFCQLYLDSVHDLLASSASLDGSGPPMSGSVDSSFASAWSGGGGGGGSGNRARTASTASASAASVAGGSSAGANGAAGPATPVNAFNLPIREDPARGFYVEGLTEYSVTCFEEAVSLLNWGLGNRILGATRMNATSSRSHTILTVKVESREAVALPQASSSSAALTDPSAANGIQAFVTRRAQLMLCDLAGSERVRRTSSKGARLEEARAINGSLHTLGQVIAALSVASSQQSGASAARVHVPWRDSKLTRLLYGNLGGSSNTYLLGTVGPDPQNVSETLSTLLFASRCMRVSASPVVAASALAAAGDYADLCSRLQARLSGIEATHARELSELQRRYEATLVDLQGQLQTAHSQGSLLDQRALTAAAAVGGQAAFQVTAPTSSTSSSSEGNGMATEATYRLACSMFDAGAAPLLLNAYRSRRAGAAWLDWIARTQALEGSAAASASTDSSASRRAGVEAEEGGELHSVHSDEEEDGQGGGHAASPAAPSRSAARTLALVHAQHRDASLLLPQGGGSGGSAASGAAAAGVEPADDPVTAALQDSLVGGVGAGRAAAPVPADMSALLRTPALPNGCTLAPAALALLAADPRAAGAPASASGEPAPETGVEDLLRAGLRAVAAAVGATAGAPSTDAVWGTPDVVPPPLFQHPPYAALISSSSPTSLPAYMRALAAAHAENARRVNALLQVKDVRFNDTKRHLFQVELALRERDSDAVMHRQMLRLLLRERDDGSGTGSASLDGSFGPGNSSGLGRGTPGLGRLTPLLTPGSLLGGGSNSSVNGGVGGAGLPPTPASGGMSPHWLVHDHPPAGSSSSAQTAASRTVRVISEDVEDEDEGGNAPVAPRPVLAAAGSAGRGDVGGPLPLGSPIQSAASSVANSPTKGGAATVSTPLATGSAALAAASLAAVVGNLPPPPPPPPSQPPRSSSRSRSRNAAAAAAPTGKYQPLPSPIVVSSPAVVAGPDAHSAPSTPVQPLPALPPVSALLGAATGIASVPRAAFNATEDDDEDDDNDYGSQLDASEMQASPVGSVVVAPLSAARLELSAMAQTPAKGSEGSVSTAGLGIAQRRLSGSGPPPASVINRLTAELVTAEGSGSPVTAALPPLPRSSASAPAPVIVSVPLHALNTSGISIAEAGEADGLDTLSVSLLGEPEASPPTASPAVASKPSGPVPEQAPVLQLPEEQESEAAHTAAQLPPAEASGTDLDTTQDSGYAGQFADASQDGGLLGATPGGFIGAVAVDDEDGDALHDTSLDSGAGGDVIECIVTHQLVVPEQLGLPSSPGAPSSGYRLLYKVHWKDSDPSEDEWFDRASILLDFPRVVAAYESSRARLRADPSLAHALYMLGALPAHVYAQYVPRGGVGGGVGGGSGRVGGLSLLSPVPESPRSPSFKAGDDDDDY